MSVWSKGVAGMEKNIFDIGSGRYTFDENTLDSFIQEAKNRTSDFGLPETIGPDAVPNEAEIERILAELMSLYQDYVQCQSIELLVTLKCRLEEVSIRFKSHVLAEEVLTINSCLPYEQRIFHGGKQPR
jgi:hypothetical protein